MKYREDGMSLSTFIIMATIFASLGFALGWEMRDAELHERHNKQVSADELAETIRNIRRMAEEQFEETVR